MTVQVAVLPLLVVAVIVAVPPPIAVILPFATVATDWSELVHVTDLSVALLGKMVAVSVSLSSTSNVKEVLLSDTEVTSMISGAGSLTVTLHVAVLPLLVVAVIVAVPLLTAVTLPFATVATDWAELVHVTLLSVALLGKTVAVSVSLSPTSNVKEVLLRVIETAATSVSSSGSVPGVSSPPGSVPGVSSFPPGFSPPCSVFCPPPGTGSLPQAVKNTAHAKNSAATNVNRTILKTFRLLIICLPKTVPIFTDTIITFFFFESMKTSDKRMSVFQEYLRFIHSFPTSIVLSFQLKSVPSTEDTPCIVSPIVTTQPVPKGYRDTKCLFVSL